jgi:hypothetical protein
MAQLGDAFFATQSFKVNADSFFQELRSLSVGR